MRNLLVLFHVLSLKTLMQVMSSNGVVFPGHHCTFNKLIPKNRATKGYRLPKSTNNLLGKCPRSMAKNKSNRFGMRLKPKNHWDMIQWWSIQWSSKTKWATTAAPSFFSFWCLVRSSDILCDVFFGAWIWSDEPSQNAHGDYWVYHINANPYWLVVEPYSKMIVDFTMAIDSWFTH